MLLSYSQPHHISVKVVTDTAQAWLTGAKRIQHVYHPHPLELCEIEDGCEARCWACLENSPGPHFVWHRCKLFLHKSCTIDLLQQTIQGHPFHPSHCLKIKSYAKEGFRCRACGLNDSNVLAYCCKDCSDFEFHLDCSNLTPSINYGSHRHPFTLFQKRGNPGSCLICKDDCESFFLRCVRCDITLHLQCHPLAPKTPKHEDHGHPLTLTKSALDSDLEYYGSRDEYYCDFCEPPRPPKDPVYHCKECDTSADMPCFISQVLPSLPIEDQTSMTSGVGEEDDNFEEDKSCTTDPKIVKFETQIAKVKAELEQKESKRKELKAQVKALQREIKELSNESSELERWMQKLELAYLSYIAPKLAKSKFKAL
ncbi:hypothetical protein SLEP1_g46917 [Rubroshorea leprosula]|uniref:Phorbol-ester/DAG-type domain-containing protein n=1 Tax=Rubroshorea leprosula TaxID=152421 RepID=A0AAV5LPJ7_9ROSI|nr:hypothetical protein SLEP1_g46917 [Rubroshorea leprosula]